MKSIVVLGTLALLLVPSIATPQHPGGGAAPRAVSPPAEAAQFDFLVGQWNLTVTPKVSGLAARIHGVPKLLGTWKAWRAFDGWGIEDELRIVDASGNPMSLSSAMRFYDANARAWVQALLDVYRGKFTTSTGSWAGGQMTFTTRGSNSEGKPIILRVRFYDITSTSFHYQQDRSEDDGKTWDEGTLKIEAKRSAPTAGPR